MKTEKEARDYPAIHRVTFIGTVCLLAMLLAFLLIIIFSTNQLTSQIRLFTEHPFTVSRDVGEVRTNLALMRIRTERLQSYNQPEDIEIVRGAIQELYLEMDDLFAEIERLYLGPAEDVAALRGVYTKLQAAQQDLLDFAWLPSSTTTVIAAYEEAHLYPLYDQFEACADVIVNYVQGTQRRIFTSVEATGSYTIALSVLILLAAVTGIIFYQVIIRRINHRLYQKNQQFDMLSETIDETFLIFDHDNALCDFVSGNAARVLGIESAQIMQDRSLLFAQIGEDADKQDVTKAPKSDTAWEKIVPYRNPKTGQEQSLHLRLYRIAEEGRDKYILTLLDRTEERRANQALEDALLNAQKANSAKRDFLSRMSHEIRTPMNAIIGMTTIAAAAIEDRNRVEDCLRKIGYSSKHLLLLINDVLDMSRIESNRMRINEEPFDLFQFLNSLVGVVYPQATAKGLSFSEHTTGFTGNTAFVGDSLRLNQILLNLLSNAIKFTPAGGKVSLTVSMLQGRREKCWLRFVVSDTGIGMDEQGLSRLYVPFEQADASIASKYGGTGLGMSITQNLVSLMGGYITVKSAPGVGTTFTVELPFAQSGVTLQPASAGRIESLSVLVVDDEQDICEHTVLLLENLRIAAEWVLSGAQAVERVSEAQAQGAGFDVCFVDWQMPGMDGVETARGIRERVGPGLPIIVISAYDWSEIEDEARAAGVNAFIAKPLFQSSLYNVLVDVTSGVFGATPGERTQEGMALLGMRLLLAEDNALNLEIAATLLEMNGAQVESVVNGQEAFTRFLEKEPGYFDAILLDVQMPVMDGCEAARQIRSSGRPDGRTIPIIATTANAFAEDVSMVLAAGMNAHVSKPLDLAQLSEALRKLCKKNGA